VAKADLPREVDGAPLQFEQLISALDTVDGETVVVRLDSPRAQQAPAGGLASLVGELHHRRPARYEGHEFSIGTPYPDRDPGQLAGGILFLDARTFRSATLTTCDGNDYFAFSISTDGAQILLQDADSTYP
jgi:hypothetical protein